MLDIPSTAENKCRTQTAHWHYSLTFGSMKYMNSVAIVCFPARGQKVRRAGPCSLQKVECPKGVLLEMGKSGGETSFVTSNADL